MTGTTAGGFSGGQLVPVLSACAYQKVLPLVPARSCSRPLASKGPFSNRASSVNCLLLVAAVVAVPGSRFSPRSTYAAATSGPKHRRCNVHNGLTWKPHGPTASLAASLHPRPGGQPSHPRARPAARMYPGRPAMRPGAALAPTSGTACRSSRCCAGSRTASWPARRAPCPGRIALRPPAPSPSSARPA